LRPANTILVPGMYLAAGKATHIHAAEGEKATSMMLHRWRHMMSRETHRLYMPATSVGMNHSRMHVTRHH
jgi:hypothetical protein